MKIGISAESTIDLPKDLLEKFDIHTTPFTILLDEEVKLDGEISPTEIFEFVKKTKVLPKTSAVNEAQYLEHFTSLLKTYDAVVHVTLSSSMSCAYENAKKASEKLENVFVVDSKSLSTGIALLAIYGQKLAQKGKSPEQIVQTLEAKVPSVQASFVLEKLDYLYKGGRCSSLSFFGANLFKIKPQIIVKNGKMGSYHKYRGTMEKVVSDYCRDTLKEFNTPDLDTAFVTYTTASDEMINIAQSALKEYGFKNIYTTKAGATISSHCGEHTLGILYINSKNE